MNLREAAGKQLRWIDTGISKGFSNFAFIDREYGSNPVLRRIFSLARKHAFESVLVEEIDPAGCGLLADDDAALALRRSDFQRSVTHRISFFRSSASILPQEKDFIGYVAFKTNFFGPANAARAHVFESVMPPSRGRDENNFIHAWRSYDVATGQGHFKANGVLYAQQNDLTFVCAHVALRSLLSTLLPTGDTTYQEINQVCSVDHKSRLVGEGHGLEPDEIEAVLQHFGLSIDKVVHEPNHNLVLPTDFQRHIYGAIESGYPCLVGFELEALPNAPAGARHIIPVLGHTFNEDTWLPDAQRAYFGGKLSYYPSENWLSTFVVHDDNFGPYLCLPRHFLKKDHFRLLYGVKREPTTFSALEAEAMAFGFCDAFRKSFPKGGEWYNRFAVFVQRGWLVLRTMHVAKEQYVSHLRAIRSWEGTPLEPSAVAQFEAALPPHFWMVEASAPELFAASRRKFGEILIAADQPANTPLLHLLLGARLPDRIVFNATGNISVIPSSLNGHVSLFELPTIRRP